MPLTNPKVDDHVRDAKKWREELAALREIILACGLTEELKWGAPCYTHQNGNVAILYELKESVGVGFFKGALLDDPAGILKKPGDNSQAVRMIKYRSVPEIAASEPILKDYVRRALDIEKAGLQVDFKSKSELVYPDEFQQALDGDPALKAAFEALTPGRRRAYNLYFSAPKQAKTRASRVESCVAKIRDGKGIAD